MSVLAERTYRIVQDMAADLPTLVGPDAWPRVGQELAALDAGWAAADDTRRVGLAARYRTLLAPYPAARARLSSALDMAEQDDDVLLRVAGLLEQMGEADSSAFLREATNQRYITGLKVGRAAQSFKLLGNVEFTFWNVAASIGAILNTVAQAVAPDAQPIAVAGAVLLLIAALAKPFIRTIEADDASVFLGLVLAAGERREAALADIVTATNTARTAGGLRLRALTEAEVAHSLSLLAQLGSVAVNGDRWRVIEEHGKVE